MCFSTKCIFSLVRNPEHFSGVIIPSSAAVIALLAIYFSLSSAKFTWVKITLISTVLSIYLFEGYTFITMEAVVFFIPPYFTKFLITAQKVSMRTYRLPGFNTYRIRAQCDVFKILPVGGVPDTRTVNCHTKMIVLSPTKAINLASTILQGTWQEQVTFAFVGDSLFMDFACKTQILCWDFPQAFLSTVNIAIKGNGPLIQLVGVREYIPIVKPEIVFWAFYIGNDFENLEREMTFGTLRNYLDPNFSQSLVGRKEEVRDQLITYSETKIRKRLNNAFRPRTALDFLALLARGKLTFHDVSTF